MLWIDLRKKKKVVYVVVKVKCRCECEPCGWVGGRIVYVRKNLGTKISLNLVTHKVNGVTSNLDCPKCSYQSSVVFTNAVGETM